MILGEPKPSYYPGYVVPKGEEVPVAKHYSEEDFKLRGYKQYWLKDPVPPLFPRIRNGWAPSCVRFPQEQNFKA